MHAVTPLPSCNPQMFQNAGPTPSAPVLVLANSLGTTRALWADLMPALTSRFTVVQFDYPGHGGAEEFESGSLRELAAALLRALDSASIGRFHFCGISMGAALGMEVAGLQPARLATLVLAHTGARLGGMEFWQARIEKAQASGMQSIAEATVARWIRPLPSKAQSDLRRRLEQMIGSITPVGFSACAKAVGNFDGAPLLAMIEAPTLVISGLQDLATPPALGLELHHKIRRSRYVEIDAAHLGCIDAPDAFERALQAFYAAPETINRP